jgi:flagella basal body P-ring formation protein FlgA
MFRKKLFLFQFLAVVFCFCTINQLFPVEIYLKEFLEYNGDTLLLRDLASLKDENDKVKAELLSLPLPLSPQRLHILSAFSIKAIIEKNYSGPFIIIGKRTICIPNSLIPHDSFWYFKELLTFLIKNEDECQGRMEIELIKLPKLDFSSPANEIKFRIVNYNKANGYLAGRIDIQNTILDVENDNPEITSLILHRFLRTAVPIRPIGKGERLAKSQLMFIEKDTSAHTQDVLLEDMPYDRYLALDDLSVSETIPLKKLKTDYIIKAGDHIKIIFIKDNIQVEMKGRSLQSGYTGSLVSVQPFYSSKKFTGRILDYKGVVVELK